VGSGRPEPDRAIPGDGREDLAVRAHGDRLDHAAGDLERRPRPADGQVPNAHSPIDASRGERFAVREEGQGSGGEPVTFQAKTLAASRRIPHLQGPTSVARGQVPSIGSNGHAQDLRKIARGQGPL